MSHKCVLPWLQLEARPDGSVSVCCIIQDQVKGPDGKPLNLASSTLLDAWKSDWLKDLRHQFESGNKPACCFPCWLDEEAGVQSKRQRELIKWQDYAEVSSHLAKEFPISLDLKLGNICNLKCRICGPYASSRWAQEILQDIRKDHTARTMLDAGKWPRANPRFWQQLETLIERVRSLEFYGGEPFLIEEHFSLLRSIINRGFSQNIVLSYNTNGTHLKPEWFELWSQFKFTTILFSLDGLTDQFEYQRYPASWSKVIENFEATLESASSLKNVNVGICHTISAFNIFNLDKFVSYMKERYPGVYLYLNCLFTPDYFSVTVLPEGMKKEIRRRFEKHELRETLMPFVQYMESKEQSQLFSQFLLRVREIDKVRGQDFEKTFPELATASRELL